MNKYSDDTLKGDSYALLPVETFNKIVWRSGDSSLAALLSVDPGRYLGEFRSMIDLPARGDKEAVTFPVLPWPIVHRKAGRESYSRYATSEMLFRPICARLRYVLYQRDIKGNKVKDENNRDIILSVTKTFVKGSGYTPQKEVFGITYDEKGQPHTYALLSIDGWSSFISYDRAAKAWDKVAVPDGQLVVYRIGTRGAIENGETVAKTKHFNGGESVDIEPLDLDKPMLITIDDAFDKMWEAAQAWKNCPRWNAETRVVAVAAPQPSEPMIGENFQEDGAY